MHATRHDIYLCRGQTASFSQTAISKIGRGVQLNYFSTDVDSGGIIQRTNHRAIEHNLIKKITNFGSRVMTGITATSLCQRVSVVVVAITRAPK